MLVSIHKRAGRRPLARGAIRLVTSLPQEAHSAAPNPVVAFVRKVGVDRGVEGWPATPQPYAPVGLPCLREIEADLMPSPAGTLEYDPLRPIDCADDGDRLPRHLIWNRATAVVEADGLEPGGR